ncbi:hypothetical protein [Aquimarina litoralis]|uniref:hypothetical protein n=1 Tax=Aquimarina litoralis TaxID=584605 RepID=UPI001C568B81|nr:hypothetical protein [Aquimarina litoralis]MBW1296903.1 hypothetical protein [Aquimarina litoralis]
MRYFILSFFIILSSCNTENNNCNQNNCDELILTNKTIKTVNGINSIYLKDKESLTNICNLLNNHNKGINVEVRNNKGFIEVACAKNRETYFHIIFSKANGPIIRYQRKYYKNDELVNLIGSHLYPDKAF